jgi:hypothetical protein
MFVPLEAVNEMCAYMPNPDLVNMARVCRHWNPTCVRHMSTQLHIATREPLRPYVDNFNGLGQHINLPTRPNYVKSVWIEVYLEETEEPSTGTDFATLYALLDNMVMYTTWNCLWNYSWTNWMYWKRCVRKFTCVYPTSSTWYRFSC